MRRPSRQVHFAGPVTGALRLENRHTGEVIIMRRVHQGNQVVLELEGHSPPKGEGPPLHVHVIEREELVVVSGVLSAVAGGASLKVRAGESVVFPAGVPHRWWNAEDQPVHTKGRVVPVADLDRFLEGIFVVANAGQAGRMPLFYVAHVVYRHRRTQRLAGPWARVLFPAVVFVGWLLGKYRGDAWPGAPKSCPGALEAQT
jgi:quercetin dioxygenase-like cupin family protein